VPRSKTLLPLVLVLLGLAVPGAAHAATVIANGNLPDSVVDRDGVTHVVWNEDRGQSDQADATHYCQIPRGGTACTGEKVFVPQPDQTNNTDFEGPKVMISPFGEVLVLTHRCCGAVLGQSDANILYLSDDGGETFDTGTAIGTVEPGEPSAPQSALLDGAGRQVVTINGPTEGPSLQAQPIAPFGGGAAPFTPDSQKARLATEYGYDPSVVQPDATTFVAAWSNLGGTRTTIRTLKCPASPCQASFINNVANWGAPVTVPDAELPRLTTGPSGTFLMYRGTAGDADNKYYVRPVDGTAVGAPRLVSNGVANNLRDVGEDANGLLHALYTDGANALAYRASSDGGVTWGDVQTLAPADYSIAHPRVTVRQLADGFSGVALWESQNGGEQNPRIFLEGLPDPSVSLRITPPPGLPLPGGGGTPTPPIPPAACRLLSFAAVDVIADACLQKSGDTYTATGGLRINGLRVELGSGRLKFDIKKRTITSSGASVTVKLGDTVLFKRAIDLTLPKGSTASIGSFDVSGGGDLLGFPLKGSVDIKFRGGGVEVPVHLALPALFGGVTGDLTVRADNVAGVHLRELHVKVGDALIGPLEIKDLFFDYDAESASWQGGANVILPPQPPGPSLKAEVGFVKGELDHLGAELTLPEPGVILDPFAVTHLKKIRFSLNTQPSLRLSGGVTINAGPTIAGVAALGIDGDLTFTLGDPAIFRVDGRVSLVSIPLATAFFELRTNGYIGFGGHLGLEAFGFSASADLSGWLFKSDFNVGAKAQICLGDLGCEGGEVVFSSVGFAGCAYTTLADFGAGYKWGESIDPMFTGCDVGPYKATAAAAQAGGTPSVSFGQDLPSGVVAVTGDGGPPHVALVGPGGARIEDTPGTKSETPTSLAFHDPKTSTTYFLVKRPAAGSWSVEPLAGSAPVTGVHSADGIDDPKVSGSVKRAASGGRARVLSYNVAPRPGQKVTFAEQGKGAAKPIGGVAKEGRGTLRFTPADGPGGTRKIIALVSSYGKPRAQLTVASYVAPPPPRPATPKRLKARRSGTKLVVSWSKAANAKRYEIRATLSDGRRLLVRGKATRLTIPSFAAKGRATVTVTGLKADGTRGKKATVKVAAKKAKKPAKKRR
jgi:hypothetical protein